MYRIVYGCLPPISRMKPIIFDLIPGNVGYSVFCFVYVVGDYDGIRLSDVIITGIWNRLLREFICTYDGNNYLGGSII